MGGLAYDWCLYMEGWEVLLIRGESRMSGLGEEGSEVLGKNGSGGMRGSTSPARADPGI